MRLARKEGDAKSGNYITMFGPPAIVLAVTALEVFVNGALITCMQIMNAHRAALKNLVESDKLQEKYQTIPRLVSGKELLNPNIVHLQNVRNEIVHHYPQSVGDKHVPEWLLPLIDKHLFYSIGSAPDDIHWQQKLQSFKLAEWCHLETFEAANQFRAALVTISGDETDYINLSVGNAAAMFSALLS